MLGKIMCITENCVVSVDVGWSVTLVTHGFGKLNGQYHVTDVFIT